MQMPSVNDANKKLWEAIQSGMQLCEMVFLWRLYFLLLYFYQELMQIIEPHLQATPVIATTRTDGEEMSAK